MPHLCTYQANITKCMPRPTVNQSAVEMAHIKTFTNRRYAAGGSNFAVHYRCKDNSYCFCKVDSAPAFEVRGQQDKYLS